MEFIFANNFPNDGEKVQGVHLAGRGFSFSNKISKLNCPGKSEVSITVFMHGDLWGQESSYTPALWGQLVLVGPKSEPHKYMSLNLHPSARNRLWTTN